MCWTFCWTKCWTLFLAKIRILSAISISSGDRLGKSLGDGAGEGNRTLVFSLEGCCSTIELHPHAADQLSRRASGLNRHQRISSRLRKSAQYDKWNFCLTTAIIAV